MKSAQHRIWTLALILSIHVSVVGCGSKAATDVTPDAGIKAPPGDNSIQTVDNENAAPVSIRADKLSNTSPAQPPRDYFPQVLIKTNHGDVVVKLNGQKAPRTVENFIDNYVDIQFYDNTIVHYVQNGTMIIGGGFTADLTPKNPRGEILSEADNGLTNKRGTIAMSRYVDARNSATCQFFINLQDNAIFDHQDDEDDTKFGYCVFGEVTKGMEVVDAIGQIKVHDIENFPNTPVDPVVIESIRLVD